MRKYSDPTVTRARTNCLHFDYLVRGVGNRAILVDISSAMLDVPKMSEFEIYGLVVFAAKEAKKKGWKIICVDLRTYGVYARNASRSEPFCLGDLKSITEPEHFLNDDYYSPPGFWIKPSTGCNVTN